MDLLQTVLAVLIAAGTPAAFLLIIYTLDLYASRTFRLVVLCFGWGAVGAFGLSYLLNTYVGLPLGRALGSNPYLLLTVAIAPVIEETAKSLSLFYVSRRSEFTYFVDGAIYGFAAGIGFSIIENFLYLSQNPGLGIPLALIRSFSTCLMHGTASGLVGAAVGRFRFRRRSGQGLGMAGGWLAAILLHAFFNGISRTPALSESLTTIVAVGIGLAGVGLIGFFINLGLQEERQWREAEQVEAFLLRQAQLGIKRKVQQRVNDPKLQEQLGQEVAQLQAEMNQIRRDVGVYVMSYVRSVFPDEALPIWSRLEQLAAQGGSADLQRWSKMLTTETSGPPRQSLFASLQER
jgi:RsiW-degrading membrane proteinase PrsW (M82 family)